LNIPFYLLGLLIRYGPQHGYKLKQIITGQIADFAKIKLPTIYYHLEKMLQKQYVTATLEREGKRPEKTIYAITESGKAYFEELLETSLAEKYLPQFGIDGVFYFAESVDRPRLLEKLIDRKKDLDLKIQVLKKHAEHTAQKLPQAALPFSQAIFDHHLDHLETEVKWLQNVIKELA
jgi:DNA-binding PadR family transcriptional regulator